MKQFQIFCLLFVLGMFAACSKPPADTYHNAEVGFSITKPSEWNYLSKEVVEATRDSVRLDDAELEKKLAEYRKEHGQAPLVAFARYPEPYPTMNPNVSVTAAIMPMEDLPLKDILNMTTLIMQKAHHDLVFVDEVQDREVGGTTAAYAKMKYTVALADGQKFPVMGRVWLVPRGKVMFTVGMTGPQEGPDVSEETFKEILSSIRIER